MNRKYISLFIILIVILSTFVLATGCKSDIDKETIAFIDSRVVEMKDELNLSEEQAKEVKEVLQKFEGNLIGFKNISNKESKPENFEKNRDEMMKNMQEQVDELSKILSEEQMEKYNELFGIRNRVGNFREKNKNNN